MRAIIIDAEAREIREVDIEGNFIALQKIVGGLIERAHCISDTEEIYVNEDGLHGAEDFFLYEGAHQVFAGNGVIIGCDLATGEARGSLVSLEEARRRIKFMNLLEVKALLRSGKE